MDKWEELKEFVRVKKVLLDKIYEKEEYVLNDEHVYIYNLWDKIEKIERKEEEEIRRNWTMEQNTNGKYKLELHKEARDK